MARGSVYRQCILEYLWLVLRNSHSLLLEENQKEERQMLKRGEAVEVGNILP